MSACGGGPQPEVQIPLKAREPGRGRRSPAAAAVGARWWVAGRGGAGRSGFGGSGGAIPQSAGKDGPPCPPCRPRPTRPGPAWPQAACRPRRPVPPRASPLSNRPRRRRPDRGPDTHLGGDGDAPPRPTPCCGRGLRAWRPAGGWADQPQGACRPDRRVCTTRAYLHSA